MKRRQFLRTTGAAALATAVSPTLSLGAAEKENEFKPATARHLPRWRGFNLLEKFIAQRRSNPPFQESDFAILSDWGFDFARLPMSYLCWTEPGDWLKFREDQLKDIDAAIELGRKYGVHVCLNFHRAPGYCINPPKERLDLWTDEKALDACALHWARFAKRYQGIPNERLSFNLINEPSDVTEKVYVRVVKRLVAAIRAEDPQRLIIADGLDCGRVPVSGLVDLGIAQSTHWYDPIELTFYQAPWLKDAGIPGIDTWPMPDWPMERANKQFETKETLRQSLVVPWKKLEQKGVGVHVGEFAVYNRTPHKVTLAWLRDCLALWKEAGWGWAMWNLRGELGVLDSERKDVQYEDFRGHKLDREMLKLLQES